MELLYELNGLIYQIQDKKSQERAFEIVEKIENHLKSNKEKVKSNKPKTSCSCIDWRDMQASPFCNKCNGSGSY